MRAPVVVALALLLGIPTVAHAGKNTDQVWADSLRRIHVNGTDLAYLDVGQGDPVVLIHGQLTDYRVWSNQIAELAKDYRVIAYSRRYHYPNVGGGDGKDYSVALHEKDLLGLIDALHLDSVHLIGNSYGATVAAWMASEHPERVRSLVLIEPTIPELMVGSPRDSEYTSERRLMSAQTRMALQDGFPDLGAGRVIEWFYGEGAIDALPKVVKSWMAQNGDALRMQYVSNAPATPFDAGHLAHIACPVLYVEGQKSPWHVQAMGYAFVKRLPATRLVVIKRVDQGMMWEDARAFNRAVMQFLDGQHLASE